MNMGGGVSAIGKYGCSPADLAAGNTSLIRNRRVASATTGIASITQPWQWSALISIFPGISGVASEPSLSVACKAMLGTAALACCKVWQKPINKKARAHAAATARRSLKARSFVVIASTIRSVEPATFRRCTAFDRLS